ARLTLAAPQVADPEQADAALLDDVLGVLGGHEHASDVLEQPCAVQADQLDQPIALPAIDGRWQCVLARLVVGKAKVGLRCSSMVLIVHKWPREPPECL